LALVYHDLGYEFVRVVDAWIALITDSKRCEKCPCQCRATEPPVAWEACNLRQLCLSLALGRGHLYFPAHDPVRDAGGAPRFVRALTAQSRAAGRRRHAARCGLEGTAAAAGDGGSPAAGRACGGESRAAQAGRPGRRMSLRPVPHGRANAQCFLPSITTGVSFRMA